MRAKVRQERVASVPIEPGIFALRYVSSASEKPPRVFVEVSPASRGEVQVVFLPGKPKGVLDEPKRVALVVAEGEGHLQLTVSPVAGGGSSAKVELQPLQRRAGSPGDEDEVDDSPRVEARPDSWRAPAPCARRGGQTELTPQGAETLDFGGSPQGQAARPAFLDRAPTLSSMICHVAKRGDVSVASGEWIGGPDAPAVIEGVRIEWVGGDAADLEYQALIQGSGGQWSRWVRAGQFAGTRARGLGLVGLRIRLTDTAQTGARLAGEAVFLGCQLIREEGRELEFTSYAGVDPLVGLRLQLDWEESASGKIVGGEEERANPEPIWGGMPLRVFKSKRPGDRIVGSGG